MLSFGSFPATPALPTGQVSSGALSLDFLQPISAPAQHLGNQPATTASQSSQPPSTHVPSPMRQPPASSTSAASAEGSSSSPTAPTALGTVAHRASPSQQPTQHGGHQPPFSLRGHAPSRAVVSAATALMGSHTGYDHSPAHSGKTPSYRQSSTTTGASYALLILPIYTYISLPRCPAATYGREVYQAAKGRGRVDSLNVDDTDGIGRGQREGERQHQYSKRGRGTSSLNGHTAPHQPSVTSVARGRGRGGSKFGASTSPCSSPPPTRASMGVTSSASSAAPQPQKKQIWRKANRENGTGSEVPELVAICVLAFPDGTPVVASSSPADCHSGAASRVHSPHHHHQGLVARPGKRRHHQTTMQVLVYLCISATPFLLSFIRQSPSLFFRAECDRAFFSLRKISLPQSFRTIAFVRVCSCIAQGHERMTEGERS